MLIKTVVDEASKDAKKYEGYCPVEGTEDFRDTELHLAEVEYDDAFAESLSREFEKYGVRAVFTSDYESSSDAGDGRDDYYTEESDEQMTLENCIVKEGAFFGVVCESFGRQSFVCLEYPQTTIYHPDNYGGRGYHYYRKKQFELIKK